ncbi:putative glucose-repressible alcohol dehydrogenase transcriptional effector like protein [Cucumispora dikerogammari]|nr:putative glucose-repressible alcohol dehydrogenase transcriptional effector like protein [Cucumispora dikerogammari]
MHELDSLTHEPDNWPTLDLSGNKLETLTPYIFTSLHIKHLNLSNNAFKVFPNIILSLSNLEILDLSDNQLTKIPKEIFYLTNLKTINLSDNLLNCVPLELGFLPYLENINLNDNPLVEPFYSSYLNGKSKGIIDFCRDQNIKYKPPKERQWKKVFRIGSCCLDTNSFFDNYSPRRNYNDCVGIEKYSYLKKPLALTIGSFNILSPHYATRAMFPYVPHYVISWDKRKDTIYKQITEHNFDIFGLQELEKNSFVKHFMPKLQNDNYESLFYTKSRGTSTEMAGAVDGCATFWKKDKFKMIEQKCVKFSEVVLSAINNKNKPVPDPSSIDENNGKDEHSKAENTDIIKEIPSPPAINRLIGKDNLCLIVLLETLNPSETCEVHQIIIANAHLFWHPDFPDVKLYQACLMIKEIQRIKEKYPFASTIILGDLNSTPESSVYHLIQEGIRENDYEFLNYDYGDFNKGVLGLNLKDVYSNTKKMVNCCKGVCCQIQLNHKQLNNTDKLTEYLDRSYLVKGDKMTTFTPNFCDNIDYIFVSNEFSITHCLERIDNEYLESVGGFPTIHLPSDHILIGGKIELDKVVKM